MPRTKGGIIRFPDVFLAFSWQLRLKKRESKALLRELEDLGLIEVIPFHGIRLREREEK
jgi:Mn-dependent DtxR family transcriptional regulator